MKIKLSTYNFLTAAILLFFCYHAGAENPPGGNSESQSYISIRGSSNINEFELINPHPAINENKSGVENKSRYLNIRISVDEFTSTNERMVHDFRKMVQESKYPVIKISIENRDLADFEETNGLTNFGIIITIAGKSQEYTVPCEVFSTLNSGHMLSGNFSVKLTDFGIEPPEKLLGLIKVNNEVCINFLFNFDSEEVLTKR